MKTVYTIIIFVGFLLMVNACSDDWLKPDPLSFFAPENVYVDEAGFESALVVCRKEMNKDNHGDGNNHLISLEFMYTDLGIACMHPNFPQQVTPNVLQGDNRIAVYNLFINSYGFIKNANTIISRIDDITWPEDRKSVRNRILGEALWFRAYWYYRLVHAYGDIPWIGEEVKGARVDYQTTTRWAILAQLQKDLEYAVENLPATVANYGDVTKGAANHLLTKVYLANCEFDKAIASATAVIDGPYALMSQRFGIDKGKSYRNLMWDLHRFENLNIAENTETIYATVDRADQPEATWSDRLGRYSLRIFGPSYWRVPDSRGQRAVNWNTVSGDTLGSGAAYFRSNDFLHYTIWKDGTYNFSNTPDLRRIKGNWIEMGRDGICDQITAVGAGPNPEQISVDLGKPLLRSNFANLNDTIDCWYPWPYYKMYAPTPRTPYWAQPHGGQGDWCIFRLAETYLLRAEAYWWKGQADQAANDINKVRLRAQALPITSVDVDIEYLFDERARELYMEESRHSEMVRVSYIFAKLNREGYSEANITSKNWYHDRVMRVNYFYTPPVFTFSAYSARLEPHNFLLPIPQTVITANTQGRINQNVGYIGAELNEPPLDTTNP